MGHVPIEKETVEILLRDESKLIRALEYYYSHFTGDGQGRTLNESAHRFKLKTPYVIDYMFYRRRYGFGMPDNREDALEFLRRLRRLKTELGP